jgi:hypothetical protein
MDNVQNLNNRINYHRHKLLAINDILLNGNAFRVAFVQCSKPVTIHWP